MNTKKIMGSLVLGTVLMAPQLSSATTSSCGGAACPPGGVNVTFNVVIPGFIRFQLGAAGAVANPTVTFDMTAAATSVGDGNAQNATADTNSGNATNGVLAVSLAGNVAGTGLRITSSPDAAATPSINADLGWGTILVASGGTISAPASTGASADHAYTGGVMNLVDTWTYTYANTAIVPANTYSGTITYTVAAY